MLVIFASKVQGKKISSAYIYELDLGLDLDLDRASKGVVLSLELDLEVECLIYSTLLRSRFRSTSSVVLFLLDVDSRSRSNIITFHRLRTRFRPLLLSFLISLYLLLLDNSNLSLELFVQKLDELCS